MADPRIAVVHSAPSGRAGRHWGDTHFAGSLAAALSRTGVDADPVPYDRREAAADSDGVVVLRGLHPHVPHADTRSVLWVISHPERVGDEELAAFDHVAVASSLEAERLRQRTETPVHVLHQASDLGRFRPPGTAPGLAVRGVIVVANHRWPGRRSPRWLRQLGVDFRIFGRGWEETSEAAHVASRQVANEHVAGLYATADVVVADQWTQMANAGFVANRLFDVAASGGFVVSDWGPGVREVFGDLVPTWATRAELGEVLDRWLGDPAGRREQAAAAMDLVRAGHGFQHRANALHTLLFD